MFPAQQKLLVLLKEVDALCRKHGIPYFLAGGTLIGAIRHKGFLPWDDDADIYMIRSDFERFAEICKTELPEDRALQAAGLTSGYTNIFPRYIAKDTTAIHTHQVLKAENDVCGEVLDILLLDPISDDDALLAKYTREIMLYSDVINIAGVYGRRFDVTAEELAQAFERDEAQGREETFRYFEESLASCCSEQGARYAMRWGGNILLFDREWFSTTIDLPFEDCMFMAPVGLSPYLRYHYGDEWYMLPHSTDRSSHDTAHSLTIPYTEALEFYTPQANHDQLYQSMRQRKLAMMELGPEDYALKTQELQIRGEVKRLELEKLCAEHVAEITQAIAQRNGSRIAGLLNGFIAWQASRDVIGRDDWTGAYRFHHPVLANLPTTLRHAMLVVLFSTERIGTLRRMLDVITYNRGQLDALETELSRCLERFAQAQDAWWLGNKEQSLQLMEGLAADYPTNYSFAKFHALCLISANGPAALEQLAGFIDAGLAENPNDGFFAKLKADLLATQGKHEQAYALYQQAAGSTYDGLLMLAIAEKLEKGAQYATPTLVQAGNADSSEEADESDGNDQELSLGNAQATLFQLLKELCALCEEHGVDYVLAPRLARSISQLGTLPDRMGEYRIYVTPENALKLTQALQGGIAEDRDFEYLANSQGYLPEVIKYYNTTTLLYPLKAAPRYRQHCLHVAVAIMTSQPMEKLGGATLRYHKFLCGFGKEPKSLKGMFHWHRCARMAKLMGRQEYAQHAFEHTLKQSQGNPASWFIGKGKFLREYPAQIFAGRSTVEYDGFSFKVPQDLQLYLGSISAMSRDQEEDVHFASSTIASTSVSYAELQALPGFDPQLPHKNKEHAAKNLPYRETRKAFVREFNLIKVAVRLKELSLELTPCADQIAAAQAAKDLNACWKLLEDYAQLHAQYGHLTHLSFNDQVHATLLWMLQETVDRTPVDAQGTEPERLKVAKRALKRIATYQEQQATAE